MNDLEDRIREALLDPRRDLPAWPDPMPRIRRAARRQRAGLAAVATAVLFAAVATPLTLLSGTGTHSSTAEPSATRARPAAPGHRTSLPSWTKRLGGEVAYKCGDYFCVMRPDGTGKRTLTATFPEWDPAWSPDGRLLAFRGYYGIAEGDYDIYVVGANGCHVTRITHGRNGTSPSWSPSGRQIAFAAGGIDVINANGSGFRQLTRATSGYEDGAPTWSAGNRIAFVRTRTGASTGQVYTMKADGSGITPLTHGAPGFGQPSWSPDGKSIAFVAYPGSVPVVEVGNAGGTAAHQVSPSSWTSFSPVWTPGGKIVFLAQRSTGTAAYIVNPDGTGMRVLYPDLTNAVQSVQLAWGSSTLPRSAC